MKKRYFLGMCIVMAAILLAACGKETKTVTDENNDQIINETSVEEEAEVKEENDGDADSVEEQVSEEEEELSEITGNPEDYEYKICSIDDEENKLIGFNLPEGTWEAGSHGSLNGSANDNIYTDIAFNQTESEDAGYLFVRDDTFTFFGDKAMYIIDPESKMLVPNEKVIEESDASHENFEILDSSFEKKDSINTVFGLMDIYYSERVADYNGSFVSIGVREWGVLPIEDNYVSIIYEYSVITNNSEWEQQSAQMEYQGKLKDIIPQMFEVK